MPSPLSSLPSKPVPHQLSDSDTHTSQPTERTTITPRNSGKVISPNTEPLTHTTKTAPSPSQTTGRVPNNAPNPGNAEVPDSAREEDGAPDMTDVRELHSQIKLQDFSQIAELRPASFQKEQVRIDQQENIGSSRA